MSDIAGWKEHPILFSGGMVSALLADRKRVTRRMSKQWLKVKAGDRLWVRETHSILDMRPCVTDSPESIRPSAPSPVSVTYEVDDVQATVVIKPEDWRPSFDSDQRLLRPSIHMPRWASRILLQAEEDARLERLLDITEEEAYAEGVTDAWPLEGLPYLSGYGGRAVLNNFAHLWQSLHTKPGERYEDNPEVVRVGRFRRVEV